MSVNRETTAIDRGIAVKKFLEDIGASDNVTELSITSGVIRVEQVVDSFERSTRELAFVYPKSGSKR